MIPADEDIWQAQCAELREDEVGTEFLAFVTDWVDTAERGMDLNPDLSPTAALRGTLPQVEGRFGRISATFLGQMLVVIISHWTHGPMVSAELTSIERRLMEDMLLLKLNDLRESAATEEEEVQPTC